MIDFTSIDEIVQETFDLSGSFTTISPSIGNVSESSNGNTSGNGMSSPPPIMTNTMPSFMIRGQKPRPQITLLFEQSLDGHFLSTSKVNGNNEPFEQLNHRLRSKHDAVLIGINTIKRDNPDLIALDRGGQSRRAQEQPQPIILDTNLEIPLESIIINRKPIIFCRKDLENGEKAKKLREIHNIQVIPMKYEMKEKGIETEGEEGDLLYISEILQILWEQMGIRKLLVEGGLTILRSFLKESLFDKIVMSINPLFSGGESIFSPFNFKDLPKISNLHYQLLGRNLIVLADPLLEFK